MTLWLGLFLLLLLVGEFLWSAIETAQNKLRVPIAIAKLRVPIAIAMTIFVLSRIALAALGFVTVVALAFNVPVWEYVDYAIIPLVIVATSKTVLVGSEWLETRVGPFLRQNVGVLEQFFRFFIGVGLVGAAYAHFADHLYLPRIFFQPPIIYGAVGIGLIITGAIGWCPIYRMFGRKELDANHRT